MRKFAFRMESVLSYRHAKENALLGELAEARRRAAEEKARLDLLHKRKVQVLLAARDRRATQTESPMDAHLESYMSALQEQVDLQAQAVEHAEADAEAKLNETLEAMKSRKALEKLKERHRDEHLRESAREEGKVLDELSVAAAAR